MKSFIGLGSNLGEREAMIRQALEEITRLPGTQLLRASSLYDTEPVGEVDQPNFLNAVAALDTSLTARQLMWNLQLIEKRLGRVRSQKWGPRTIDLDLLFFKDQQLETEFLTLPHPRMALRRFVLVPLNELAPGLVHPVLGKSISELLAQTKDRSTVTRWTPV